VGAGHAHLEVLRQHILEPLAAEVELISARPHHHYSGMVPGYLAGIYTEDQIAFDLEALARRAGVPFRRAFAAGIDPEARAVHLDDGSAVPYDLVSFNVGSRTAGGEAKTIRTHAVRVKPMSEAVRLKRRLEELTDRGGAEPLTVVVVGAGAAGVEVAFSTEKILTRSGRKHRVTLIEAADEILGGYSERFRRLAEKVLQRKMISVLTGIRVERIDDHSVTLDNGKSRAADVTIWLTGAVAWPIFESSTLSCDPRGFLLTDDALRSVDDTRVFAVGDCGTMVNYPETPKAGVYAVRQGPVLAAGLRAALNGMPSPTYRPQGSFLSLLSTADGKALLRYGDVVSCSRWAWWLKDWIDRRFMSKYQSLTS